MFSGAWGIRFVMEKGSRQPETRAVSDPGLQDASDHSKAVPGCSPSRTLGLAQWEKHGINAATVYKYITMFI